MYIVQEIQTTNGVSSLLPAETYNNRNDAESAFHTKLAAAAISSVAVHAVLMYDDHGNVTRREFYEHIAEISE